MTSSPDLSSQLSKSFEPQKIESHWYAEWERRGLFAAGQHVPAIDGRAAQPFAIQFPPPNVTGTLH
ncbi:hypothetical protein, partial [Allopusillimonas soli]|uniref:hypothetical protein n=1 Tax=Allopusillimonas soli TaxID=659016 RepID=UPI001C552CEC